MSCKRQLSPEEIEAVLEKAFVLRLGMCADNEPYVVPLSFAFRDGAIFIHSSPKGKKIETLRRNPRVCFEVDVDAGLLQPMDPDDACRFGVRFSSVVGYGTARILEDPAEKSAGLKAVLSHYSDREYELPENKVAITAVIRIEVESMTGRRCE